MVIDTFNLALQLSNASNRVIADEVWRLSCAGARWYAPGGGDIDPALYGQPNLYSWANHPEIDRVEAKIIENVLDCAKVIGTKLLAICRGHQLLGVVLGVSLIQDISAETGTYHHHDEVKLKSVKLADILGVNVGIIEANSLHHQALAAVPSGWQLAARWGGIIEAIEHEELPVVSTQWHPEMIPAQYKRLVKWLSES